MYYYETKYKKEDAEQIVCNHMQFACGKDKDKIVLKIEKTQNRYIKNLHFVTGEDKPLAEAQIEINDKKIIYKPLKRKWDFITGLIMTVCITAGLFGIGFWCGFIGGGNTMLTKLVCGAILGTLGLLASVFLAVKYTKLAKRNAIDTFTEYLNDHFSAKIPQSTKKKKAKK